MASDPAFLFYPNDFIGGTMGMTLEEKGAYMELLMAQFNRGHFSDLMATRIIGESLWAVLKQKFTADESGCYYNKRLEVEVNKRKAYSESRRNNLSGNKDKNTHMDTHMESHMATHMEAHMENRNSNRKIGGAGGKKTKLKVVASALFDQFWKEYPKQIKKQKALESWNNANIDAELFTRIMLSLAEHKKSPDLTKENGQFIPHPTTWINQKRWEDVLTVQQTLFTTKPTGGNQLDKLRAE